MEWVRQKYPLPPRYALFVGTNKPHKNLRRLLEVVSRLTPGEDFRPVVVGPRDPRYAQGPPWLPDWE